MVTFVSCFSGVMGTNPDRKEFKRELEEKTVERESEFKPLEEFYC